MKGGTLGNVPSIQTSRPADSVGFLRGRLGKAKPSMVASAIRVDSIDDYNKFLTAQNRRVQELVIGERIEEG